MNIGSIHDCEGVTVVLAQPLFDFRIVEVKANAVFLDLGIRTRTAVVDNGKCGHKRYNDEQSEFSTQSNLQINEYLAGLATKSTQSPFGPRCRFANRL